MLFKRQRLPYVISINTNLQLYTEEGQDENGFKESCVSLEGNGVLDVGVRPVRTAVHQWQTPRADLLQEPQVVLIVQRVLCGETLSEELYSKSSESKEKI
jgi:hypothetical protein